jgi:cupredoxin-like protein
MSRRSAAAVLASALALPALLGCSSGLNRPVQEVTATTDPHGVQHVRLEAHSYYWKPNRIVVRARAPVELAIHNAAFLTPHNFTCLAPEAGINIKRSLSWFGGTRRVRFIPVRPGEYPFLCGVDSHARHGMTGVLVVQ